MVTLAEIRTAMTMAGAEPVEYGAIANLNLYKSDACEGLVTQMAAGRQLQVTAIPSEAGLAAIQVCLCEDDYPGWLAITDLAQLVVAATPYQAPSVGTEDIQQRIPQVIAFTEAAMATPNEYLWGGTVAPNYDCSGLMQAAFGSVGDRKSTRLNSSHRCISYAVFCLKKKNKKTLINTYKNNFYPEFRRIYII